MHPWDHPFWGFKPWPSDQDRAFYVPACPVHWAISPLFLPVLFVVNRLYSSLDTILLFLLSLAPNHNAYLVHRSKTESIVAGCIGAHLPLIGKDCRTCIIMDIWADIFTFSSLWSTKASLKLICRKKGLKVTLFGVCYFSLEDECIVNMQCEENEEKVRLPGECCDTCVRKY